MPIGACPEAPHHEQMQDWAATGSVGVTVDGLNSVTSPVAHRSRVEGTEATT